jgi:hypothetical protein
MKDGDPRVQHGIDYANLQFSGRHSEQITPLPCQVCYGVGIQVIKNKKKVSEVTCQTCRGTGKYIMPGFKPVRIRMGSSEVTQGERRTPDSKLSDMLKKAGLIEAAEQLRNVYESRTAGMAAKIANLGGGGKSTRIDDYAAIKELTYLQWRDECRKMKYSPIMTVDVVVFGESCSNTDKAHKMRNGEAAKQLILCLGIWRDLFIDNVSHVSKTQKE